ncbi:Asp23/Gls24 family envelope stress response protein [Haliovirga abyssi]|uniref:Alkaline-shock protein n=1 Tax=Haliovirga abyssi TaxID=2996794 RepID=A0AAU9DCN6_9FUSO|nr:Asp23/Gls24 family envelope stress response protein [Haliovirga abyssi]BDU50057.1 alkaline-shock protein [Haliovirga abyssi]
MAELGNVKIANEVVSIIAGIAASEVEGVYEMNGGVVEGLTGILGKKNLTKGVKVEVGEKECSVDVYLTMEYGVSIPDVSEKVQENVIKSINTMTGLKVVEVNIFVQGVYIKKDEPVVKVQEEVSETDIELK